MVRWLSRKQPRIRSNSNNRISNLRRKLWLQPLEDRAVPATFTVNLPGDDTTGMGGAGVSGDLRYCITQANSMPGADTILFSGVTSITLSGLAEIQITDSLTIDGVANQISINGSGARIFNVDDVQAARQIVVSMNKLDLSNSSVTTSGGVITVANEKLTITNSSVSNGEANNGGGIALTGRKSSLTVINSTFSNNKSSGFTTGNGDGGAITILSSAQAATVMISGCTFTGNSAVRTGGAIMFGDTPTGYTFVIENSTFTGNSVNNTEAKTGLASRGGGAICVNGDTGPGGGVIRNCTIVGNTSNDDGGGIEIGFSRFIGDLLIQSCTIMNNTAGTSAGNVGGGIYQSISTGGYVTIDSCIVSGNIAGPGEAQDIFSLMPIRIKNSAVGDVGNNISTNSGKTAVIDLGGNLAYGANLFMSPTLSGPNPQVLLPLAGSPVINAGSITGLPATDQRGLPRFGQPDIGAVELQSAPATPWAAAVTPDQLDGGGATYSVTVRYYNGAAPIDQTTIGNGDVTVKDQFAIPLAPVVAPPSIAPFAGGVQVIYTFTAPGNVVVGAWDSTDNGIYNVELAAGAVTDTALTAVPGGVIGRFEALIRKTITVTTALDVVDAFDGLTSLREAVTDASDPLFPRTLDIIQFAPGLNGIPIVLSTQQELLITDNVIIQGNGPNNTIIDGDLIGGTNRIFNISGNGLANTTISGVTLTGGSGVKGAAIYTVSDPVTLNNVVVSGNSGSAGALAAGVNGQYGNTFTVNDSTISNNTSFSSSVFGGGFNVARSFVVLNNSVVSGNIATNSGGGFYGVNSRLKSTNSTWDNNQATGTGAATRGGGAVFLYANLLAEFDNSTISGNFAMFSGGGLVFRPTTFYGQINIRNTTITGNRANNVAPSSGAIGFGNGAGGVAVLNINSPLNIESSVIAGNTAPFFPDIATAGQINLKNSLIGTTNGLGIINNMGGNLFNVDPRLGALAKNGGSVSTHLPGPGSPLINAGSNPTGQAFDQRGAGFPRVVGSSADIGAVESTGTSPVVFAANFPDMNTFGGTTHRIQVRFADDVGMNPTTIIGNNNAIRVTSPLENYNKLATFVSYNALTGVAEYDIPAAVNASLFPVIWDGSDNAIYTVSIEPNQVADSGGTFVNQGVIGTVRVRILEVNNNGDSGPGTLRQAILDANAFRGPDTIAFNLAGAQTITLNTEIAITDTLEIPGPGKSNLTINQAGSNRFFSINDGITGLYMPVTISGITFAGGNINGADSVTTNRGGAIIMAGDDSLTIRDSDFINNFASAGGGAIALNAANAYLNIERSLFQGNGSATVTQQFGGALRLTTNTTTTINESTFKGNTAARGGAIAGLYASVIITNSTISGNTATTGNSTATFTTAGGGLDLTGTIPGFSGIVIRNSTISGNVASHANTTIDANAGGINLNLQGHVLIQNSTVTNNSALTTTAGTGAGGITVSNNAILTLDSSIVSGNIHNFHSGTAVAAPDMSASGSVSRVFMKNSLVGIATSKFIYIDQGNNLTGTTATPLDAMLGALANNGGSTETHLLLAGSPAIDAGSNPASLSLDQRGVGFPRVNGPRIDMGALESNASNAPVAIATLPANVTAAGPGSYTVTVDYFDNVGLDSTTVDVTDLSVAGAGGYSEPSAATANIVINTPTQIRVNYVFNGPGGGWANANNGDVSITLNAAGAVTDGTTPVTVTDRVIGKVGIAIGKVFTVTDGSDTGGVNALRAQITGANSSIGTDTIVFNGPMSILLTSALPTISDSLVIQGFADPTQVVIDGGGAVRLFDINARGIATVTFDGLTLTNGKLSTGALSGAAINVIDDVVNINNSVISNNEVTGAGTGDANGGAINLSGGGTLNITKSVLSGNKASSTGGDGGAIFALRNAASITIQNSTLSGNSAGRSGGAIYMAVGGDLVITGTTLSGNTVLSRGGAIYFGSRVGPNGFIIRNSTISGNSATGLTNTTFGGGVFLSASFNGTAVFQNSTVTGNTIPSTSTTPGFGGGGIGRLYGGNAGTGNIFLESTIVAGNTQTGSTAGFPDISSLTGVTAINSLIGVRDRVGFTMNSTGNLGGSATIPLDARLGALALNGAPAGSPLTHALLAGSPAIDKGSNPANLLFDQRGAGFNRKSGTAVDIGAFEFQVANPPPQVSTITFNGGNAQRSMLQSIEVTFSEAVTFPNGIANAFQLTRYGMGTPGTIGLSFNQVGNAVTITFNNLGTIALDPNQSTPDGQYQLTIVADQVQGSGGTLDGNMNGIAESNAIDSVTSKVHRLFGDGDGNGSVTAADFNAFRLVYGSVGPSFFDYDGSNSITASDFNQFRTRYGASGFLP